MNDALDVLARTADPAFGTDEGGRIVLWNRAIEQLLGHKAGEVLGRPCCDLLCGTSVFGNRLCDENCTIMSMARRREGIHRFEMDIPSASGHSVRVGVSIVVVPGGRPSQFTIVHLLQSLSDSDDSASLPFAPTRPAEEPRPIAQPLTTREVEVLRLVADGRSSQQIADLLFISVATVRNHVQNVLRKLDVHGKPEAVSFALRNRLI